MKKPRGDGEWKLRWWSCLLLFYYYCECYSQGNIIGTQEQRAKRKNYCAPARRDQAEAHVDVVRLAAAATDEMWKENQGDEED